MKKNILSLLCFVSLVITGCNYLDMVPEKDIETIETIFEDREKAKQWWNSLYSLTNDNLTSVKNNVSYVGADEFIACQALYQKIWGFVGLNIADGQQMSQDPYGSRWESMYRIIRRSNIFLENIVNTYNITDEERKWWIADVKAVKALVYFELMRCYGPICLIPKNMPVDLDISAYQLPRQPVDVCFAEIVNLLDEAIADIPMHNERATGYEHTFTKEAAYALKAKVLLYSASKLFNGNIMYSDFKNKNGELLFNTTYDHNKWLLAAEAADKAAEICALGGRCFRPNEDKKKTKLLNKMRDIELIPFSRFDNPEFLLEGKIAPTGFITFILPYLRETSNSQHYEPMAFGALYPSMKMVEMYYTENGLPINADRSWDYSNRYKLGSESSYNYEGVLPLNSDVINLHTRREPRFYANIAGDRMYYQRGNDRLDQSYNLLVKAHKGEKPWGTEYDVIITDNWQNHVGYWLKKHLYSHVDTKGYLGFLSGNETFALIRLAEVYLMQAEAWNEYLEVPDARVYDPLNKVRERAGIPSVQESWQTYSNEPNRINSRDGMRKIIQQEYNIEFAFEGHRYWNIRRWMTAPSDMNEKQYGWNVLGTDFQTFYNNEDGPIVVGNRNKFISPRHYFDPIKAEEVLISGMKQNPGW